MEKHPLHLKIPELQKSEEVQDAVEKQERLTDETLPNDPTERIEAYMARLENIFLNKDERVRERNLEMLRDDIYDTFIIKPEHVPESYFELQKQVARERGQPVENILQNVREQMIATAIEDQKHSLDQWIDYLTSADATYPTWFKYFVFRNITKLSQFDKELGKFKDRTTTTVAPYPDVFREPLAQICDIYEKVAADNKVLKTDPEIQREFSKKFPKLYAELITKSLAASMEGEEEIKGEWVKYTQGNKSDAERLYRSLEGKGTGWCTAGHSTAETQIESGDFYVYYTYDKHGQPTQPRIAIRMNGTSEIGEVRGIQQHQSLEPQMNDILEKKLTDFGPEADKYKKKTENMRRMTVIEEKVKNNKQLTRDDLVFLYELNAPIEGFGYQKDPRIAEIRQTRNLQEDLPIVFDCQPEQIARTKEDIKANTVAYIGKLTPGIFKVLPDTVEYIYESFPDKKLSCTTVETNPQVASPQEVKQALLNCGFKIYEKADYILKKVQFTKENTKYDLVSFSVKELGLSGSRPTAQEIYKKAEELGLELCPPEVGPLLRLQYTDQPMNEYLIVATQSINDSNGNPCVFNIYKAFDGLWFSTGSGKPDQRWNLDFRFSFLRRKTIKV